MKDLFLNYKLNKEHSFYSVSEARAEKINFKVDCFGELKFPISEKNIKLLIKGARLASFGWREKTIVDTRVRNVWEVPREKINLVIAIVFKISFKEIPWFLSSNID